MNCPECHAPMHRAYSEKILNPGKDRFYFYQCSNKQCSLQIEDVDDVIKLDVESLKSKS